MEDRAPSRAFAKFAEVWRERGGGDRDKRGVTQHGLDICGNLYPDLVESPLTLVLELLRASFIFVKRTKVSTLGNTARRNRAISKLIKPHPIIPTLRASLPLSRHWAARAALAAVRFALIADPSSTASGRPVCGEFKITTAEARSTPRFRLSGNEETHLTPAIRQAPPR